MPEQWMSVAEAAASLKCHTRTIERRIASGKIQARRGEDGLLQVLIPLPDAPDTSNDTPDQAFETVRELADNQVSLVTGSASALVKFAQDDAQRAREQMEIIRVEAHRARKHALAAWLVVAGLGLGVMVAVGWTASKITSANADVRRLSEYAEKMEAESTRLIQDRDKALNEAQLAKLQSAEASGKLAAYVEQHKILIESSDKRPTTRPTNLFERIASVFDNQ